MESELFSPGAGVMSLFCVSVQGEVAYLNVSVLRGGGAGRSCRHPMESKTMK